MVLFPELDVLIVHWADTDSGRGVSDRDGVKLLDMIVGARQGEPAPDAALQPLCAEKLSGRAPKPLRDDLSAVAEDRCDALQGRYMFSEDSGIRLYVFDGRLFAQSLGMPLGDVELFQAPDGSLGSPIAGIVLEPIHREHDRVEALRMTFRGRTQTGKRTD